MGWPSMLCPDEPSCMLVMPFLVPSVQSQFASRSQSPRLAWDKTNKARQPSLRHEHNRNEHMQRITKAGPTTSKLTETPNRLLIN